MTTSTQTNFRSNMRATYIRLLTSNDQPPRDDWLAAVELIRANMATGTFQISKAVKDFGGVTSLARFAPTLEGRLFADKLAEEARKETLSYRLFRLVLSVSTFVLGWVAGVMSDVSKAALLHWLGIGG